MDTCVYCLNKPEKLTKEHVIPKQFYPPDLRTNNIVSIQVPTCESCNTSASLIQEQARVWLALLSSDTNPIAEWLTKNEIRRSFSRRPKLTSIIKDKGSLVNLYSPGGIYLKDAARFDLIERDWRNLEKFLDLVVRGVFYDVYKKMISKDAKIIHVKGFSHFFKQKHSLKAWFLENKSSLLYRDALKEVYVSWSAKTPESSSGVILSLFYGKLSFISFFWENSTHPKEYEVIFRENRFRILD